MAENVISESVKVDKMKRILGGKSYSSDAKIESLLSLLDATGDVFITYDKANNTFTVKKANGTVIFSINLSSGAITLAGEVSLSQSIATLTVTNLIVNTLLTYGIAVASLVKQIEIPLVARGSSLSTNATTYENLNVTEFLFNPSNYPGTTITLEAICRAGASGDPARTLYIDLYDVTGGASVIGSEMTTSSTEAAGGNATPGALVRLRGSDFRANLTTGDRTYIARWKSSSASYYVDLYKLSLIIRF